MASPTLPALSLLSLAQVAREHRTVMLLLEGRNWPQACLCLSHHLRTQGLYTVKITDVYKVIKIMYAGMHPA